MQFRKQIGDSQICTGVTSLKDKRCICFSFSSFRHIISCLCQILCCPIVLTLPILPDLHPRGISAKINSVKLTMHGLHSMSSLSFRYAHLVNTCIRHWLKSGIFWILFQVNAVLLQVNDGCICPFIHLFHAFLRFVLLIFFSKFIWYLSFAFEHLVNSHGQNGVNFES